MAQTPIRDMPLGLYLKIISRGAVYNTLNDESPMWEYFLRTLKTDVEAGGEERWNMRKSYGAAAFQFTGQLGSTPYPAGQKSGMAEAKAYYKDASVSIEVPISVLRQAQKDIGRYGAPIAEEVEAKGIASARGMSATLTQDGSGIIGEVASLTISSGKVVVQLKTTDAARSHIGWFVEEDKIKAARNSSGEQAATTNGGTAVDYWLVTDINRADEQVTLEAYSAAGVAIVTATNSSTDITASDFLRRYGTSWVNPAAISSSTDYGLLTEQWAGLETLGHDDGRLVNNITMSGALKGSRYNCNGDLFESQHIQEALSNTKTRVGQNRYKYDSAFMAPEAYDLLVDSRESDRRFNASTDNVRGTNSLKYAHRKDNLEFETDEFIKKSRCFIVPNGDALFFNGSDFDFVNPEDSSAWNKKVNSSGQYTKEVVAHMEACGLFGAKHSAAITTIHGFVLS